MSTKDPLKELDKIKNAVDDTNVKSAIENLEQSYPNLTDKQKEALAKNLPVIAEGTLSAVAAFRKSPPDAISGSAGILSMLGGLAGCLGPEGAVVGALFSIVSMILSFFAPQQPSLLDQIEKLLRNLKADEWKQKLTAVGNAVNTWETNIERFMSPANPDDPDYPLSHGGVRTPDLLRKQTDQVNLIEGNAALTIFTAQEWLKDPANQELDAWPEILNLHCIAYARLRQAVTQAYLYAFYEPAKQKAYVDGDTTRQTQWTNLQTSVEIKFYNMAQGDLNTSDFLNIIVPVARERGLHIFHWDDSTMKVASGPKAYQQATADTLREHCHRMAITPPRQGVTDPAAQYDVWVMDSSALVLNYNTLNLQTRRLDSQSTNIGDPGNGGNAKNYLDWWPVPEFGTNSKFQIFFAVDTSNWQQPGGQLQLYEWDRGTNTFTKQGWQPSAAAMMTQVRVATLAAAAPDDPDKDRLPDNFVGTTMIYATIAGSSEIFVWASAKGGQASVQIPWASYTGISVDPQFLWLYGPGHVTACTSHASVLSHLNSKPSWMGCSNPNRHDLLTLSTCEDGTILIVGTGDRANEASCATYDVDFTQKTVVIDTWLDVPGGDGAVECQKLPIFGWARVEALAALLKQPAPSRSTLLRR